MGPYPRPYRGYRRTVGSFIYHLAAQGSLRSGGYLLNNPRATLSYQTALAARELPGVTKSKDAATCLRPALNPHGLVDDIPAATDIAVPGKHGDPRLAASSSRPHRWRASLAATIMIGELCKSADLPATSRATPEGSAPSRDSQPAGLRPQQHFDGAAFVHRLVCLGHTGQRQCEVEDPAGVDLAPPDGINQVG